jgi:hypothetical protein
VLFALGGAECRALDAIDVADQQIGKPYGWGDKGPDSFDCSGLTQYSYATVGVPLSDGTAGQVRDGIEITKVFDPQLLQRGDLLFFDTDKNHQTPTDVNHVGLYEGNGRMVSAMWYNCEQSPQVPDCINGNAIDSVLLTGGSYNWSARFLSARRLARTHFDAVTDFSLTNGNPNGQWTYGYVPYGLPPTGPFALLTTPTPDEGGITGWDQWSNGGYFEAPFVVHNALGAVINFSGVTLPTNLLNMHPTLSVNSVVRWTAQTAGSYQVAGHFEGLATMGTTTRAWIIVTGTQQPVFNEQVIGFGIQHPFGFTVMGLNARDTIDFEVDRDTNPCGGTGYCHGDEAAHDSTGFTVQITKQ